MSWFRLFVLISFFEIGCGLRMGSVRAPVILVPGFLGSKLSYQYVSNSKSCEGKKCSYWRTLWFNILQFFTPTSFSKKFSLVYDNQTGEMISSPDLIVKPPVFGEVDGIEYISDLRIFTDYYHKMIRMLSNDLGYKPGVDLFGAGYDFRFITTPKHFEEYSKNMTDLIEKSVEKTGRKAFIVSHSLGGPLIRRFIVSKSQEWKDRNIERWFSVNGAFAGSVSIIGASLLGQNYILPRILGSKWLIKTVLRTFPSIYYLFPSEKIFGKDFVVVNNNGVLLDLSQIDDILNLYKEELPSKIYKNKTEIWEDETVLGVKMYCFYTGGIKTIKTVGVDGKNRKNPSNDVYGDGDGLVNIESLESCKKLFSKEKENVDVEYHEGIDHKDSIKHKITLDRLKSLLQT